MNVLSIPYSDDLLIAAGKSKEAFEQEMRFLLAVKLFELNRLSLGKAAELCGMNKVSFMAELGRTGIPVINLDDDQIRDEIAMREPAAIADSGPLIALARINQLELLPKLFSKIVKKIKPSLQALPENGIYIREELLNAVLKEANE